MIRYIANISNHDTINQKLYCLLLAGTTQYSMKKYKYYTKAIPLPNGKRKYVRAKTKGELEEKLSQLRVEAGLGIDISNDSTFREYAEYWLLVTKKGKVSANTLHRYERMLENHIYPYIGANKLRDIRAPAIRLILTRCSHLARDTQAVIRMILRSIFSAAVDDDILMRSPVPAKLDLSGEPAKETPPLLPEQEAQLLEAAKGLAVYPFVLALMETGMRRGEVTALMWSDIDFNADVIHIRRHVVTDTKGSPRLEDGAKTDAGVRDVPLTLRLKTYLLKSRAHASSVYVFPNSKGGFYSASAFTALWAALDRRAGFHTHPHQLRHTYATKLFESGLDLKQVQYVMGHADPETTLKVYTHYRQSLRNETTIQQVKAALGG